MFMKSSTLCAELNTCLLARRKIITFSVGVLITFVYICAGICMFDLYGVWISQEIYQKFMPWKWTFYQPYFKESCVMME